MLEFAGAVIGPDPARLDAARSALGASQSPATVTGASAIAGNFSKNDRIANAIGIPVDPSALESARELRSQLGLDSFGSAENTFRHFPAS